jgi:quinol monooxygenase YgiN
VIIIAGSMSFDPSDRDDVIASLREITELSRVDDGCVSYSWAEDLNAPDTFRFFECWETQAHLDAHLAAPHEAAFGQRNLGRMTGATAEIYSAADIGGAAR